MVAFGVLTPAEVARRRQLGHGGGACTLLPLLLALGALFAERPLGFSLAKVK